MSNEMSNQYWFQDLNILLNMDKLDEFIPKSYMSYPQKVNALIRASIYIGFILSFIYKNYLYLYIPILTMILTIVLYALRKVNQETEARNKELIRKQKNENMNSENSVNNETRLPELDSNNSNKQNVEYFGNQKECLSPTVENPFMNPLPFDSRVRKQACDLEGENAEMVSQLFHKRLFKDVGDFWDKGSSQRQFYTLPGTTYPNDTESLGKWLYGRPKTCKEGNGAQCYSNLYNRLPNLVEPGSHAGAAI